MEKNLLQTRLNSFRWATSAILSAIVMVVTVACSDASGPEVNPPPGPDIQTLTLRTFDGSGQAVHPDPAETPLSWNGSGRQLAITPYPNGDASKENPSWYSARSFSDWFVPDGVVNPVAKPVSGYLSDPDELYNPETNEVWLYYRAVVNANEIFLIRAKSPTERSEPILVASGANHTIVSPTVVRRGAHDWLMWSVNSGALGCTSATTTVELRHSVDGVSWSDPLPTDLADRDSYPWHIDVEWIPERSEFWAVYNVKQGGSCTTATLHFATSKDGLTWTPAQSPVLNRGVIAAFKDIVYRAATYYDAANGVITLWYSGARFENGVYVWRIATERLKLDDFFARLNSIALGGASPSVTNAPPLTNADAP